MIKLLKTFIFASFLTTLCAVAAFGQKGETVEKRVKFPKGKSSVTIKGFIADRMTSNIYIVRARAGQTLSVVFNSPRRDVDVCVLFPNSEDFCGRRKYSLRLTADGDYEILVDSRREILGFTITVSVR
jgi:hypothetical protein